MPPPEGEHEKNAASSGKDGGGREVIFEFKPIGGSVKLTAVDVASGVEVSVVGPAGPASHRELERIALQKLQQRLGREVGGAPKPPESSDGGTGGGIIV